ncbi:N-acetyltransferase family protein [Limnohabitans sp.]|uniref:GNAT family N-acetyltransferase n=1 Tax=Limnohabitans sp. TaxID=1907725 RepID=UPI0035AED65A
MNSNATSSSGFWRRLWQRWFASADPGAAGGARRDYGWVPIRALAPRHKPRILAHLQALSDNDRYLRFGYPATDEHIRRYVDGLNFQRDEIFGIFNRRLQLVAMAHVAFSVDPKWSTCAEFGVSVAASQRGRGMGAKLFDRAVTYARNQGVHMFFVHALSENAAMLKIARNAGARVERDGSESEAYLTLPEATLDSQVSGLLQDRMAELDYQLKLQASQFRQWLGLMQEVRKGVREARHHNDPQP